MAWCPFAIKRDIGRGRYKHTPVRMVAHTAVVNATELKPGATGAFWHFYLGRDGQLWQYVDTDYRAGAETMPGADGSISWESWDGYRVDASGKPIPLDAHGVTGWRTSSDVPAWTAAQVATISRLMAWLWEAHPTIPRRMATTSKADSTSHGVAWHRLGVPARRGDTTSITGGALWSSAAGKVCPGERRTSQLRQIYTDIMTTPEEPEMITAEDRAAIANDVLWTLVGFRPANNRNLWDSDAHLLVQQGQLAGQVAGLTTALGQVSAGQPIDVDAIKAAVTEALAAHTDSMAAVVDGLRATVDGLSGRLDTEARDALTAALDRAREAVTA